MIDIYLYNKKSCVFLWQLSGHIESLMSFIDDNKDFTLTPPPDYDHVWRWIDDKWIADNTAE